MCIKVLDPQDWIDIADEYSSDEFNTRHDLVASIYSKIGVLMSLNTSTFSAQIGSKPENL
jgi:hypothetical protein